MSMTFPFLSARKVPPEARFKHRHRCLRNSFITSLAKHLLGAIEQQGFPTSPLVGLLPTFSYAPLGNAELEHSFRIAIAHARMYLLFKEPWFCSEACVQGTTSISKPLFLSVVETCACVCVRARACVCVFSHARSRSCLVSGWLR